MVIEKKQIGWILTAASFVFIGTMTLVPYPELVTEVQSLPNTCLICGDLGGQDVLLNIVLFVPLGVGFGLTGISRWRALAIVVLTTVTVESLQYTVIAGRHASLSDLLSNSAGGWLGITLAYRWRELLLPSPRRALWLAGLGMFGWLGLQALSGALLSVAVPQKTYFVGWWAPRLRDYDQFQGRVLSATLDDIAIPPTRPIDASWLREHLQRDSFALDVVATSDVTSPWVAPIVVVVDGRESELFLLAQSGRDLFFRVRMRTGDLRVRTPALRLPNVAPAIPGQTLRIRAGRDRGRLFLQVDDGKENRRELAMSPSWGWSFLIPFEYAFGPEVHFLTALWIGGLLVPIAYWAHRGVNTSRGKWRARALLVVMVALGLGVVPFLTRLRGVHWSEWLSAAVGLLVGWWLAGISATGRLNFGLERRLRSATSG